MDFSNLVPVTGMIVNITRGNDCCSQMITMRAEGGIVNFIVDTETMVIESRQLRTGMRVAAFYNSSLPVPLIFPPQYRAELVTVVERNEQVMLNFFDQRLVAQDESLQINIGRSTMVRTVNGQNYTCSPGEHVLLVFYSAATRSIPPQTTPRKIVVFC